MKFAIRIDAIWRLFMLILGATAANSYVEFDGEEIHLRFGRGFSQRIARANVTGAARSSWSLIDGLGVRAGGQIFGLIGSTSGVVELQLEHPVQMRFVGWPWSVRRIAVSLEDPEGFLDVIAVTSPSALPNRT